MVNENFLHLSSIQSLTAEVKTRQQKLGVLILLFQSGEKEVKNRKGHGHSLSKITPTGKKKWPQKPCVLCRKYGVRNDTRYICNLCNIALCKEPCFSEYHCNK